MNAVKKDLQLLIDCHKLEIALAKAEESGYKETDKQALSELQQRQQELSRKVILGLYGKMKEPDPLEFLHLHSHGKNWVIKLSVEKVGRKFSCSADVYPCKTIG